MDDQIEMISPQEILPSVVQPRLPHDEVQLLSLAASMREHGLIQSITVFWDEHAGMHRLVHGERRWRSALLAGLPEIPCRVQARPPLSKFLQMTVSENEERAELTPMELAWALHTFRLLANLKALAAKYDTLAYLETAEEEAEAKAAAIEYGDEVDQAATRQQVVIDFLEDRLNEALAVIGKSPDSWRPLVSWDECVRRMGIDSLPPRRRRQVLELLNLADAIQVEVAQGDISEYAARGLAQYPGDVQERIVEVAQNNGGIAHLTRAAIDGMAAQFAAEDAADGKGDTAGGKRNGSLLDEYQPTLPMNLPDAAIELPGEAEAQARAAQKAVDRAVSLFRETEALILESVTHWGDEELDQVAEWLDLIAEAAGLELQIRRHQEDLLARTDGL